MKLVKPVWVNHDHGPIFSVDIHPDGVRFATGGQDKKVKIWSMLPVQDPEVELDSEADKMLCTMTTHTGPVNCVRWSTDGLYLASGGDDRTVLIWEKREGFGAANFEGEANIENWAVMKVLRKHVSDVTDIAWMPGNSDNTFLASCSVDNTVIIWSSPSFEVVKTLKHDSFVKGLSWDPVGKYLASQADDNTAKVWRATDWREEAEITEPFSGPAGAMSNSFFKRLSWSPDGQYLVVPHAYSGTHHVAAVICRDDWQQQKMKKVMFVGHVAPVVVVRWNHVLFGESTKKTHSFCALGSRDNSVSIWRPDGKRAVVGARDLFTDSVQDISWGPKGYNLIACSTDGTVVFMEWDESELGKALTKEETDRLLEHKYGRRSGGPTLTIAETPQQLLYLHERHKASHQPGNAPQIQDRPAPKDIPTGAIRDLQQETTTVDGRRRITPFTLIPTSAPVSAASTLHQNSSMDVSQPAVRRIQPRVIGEETEAGTDADRERDMEGSVGVEGGDGAESESGARGGTPVPTREQVESASRIMNKRLQLPVGKEKEKEREREKDRERDRGDRGDREPPAKKKKIEFAKPRPPGAASAQAAAGMADGSAAEENRIVHTHIRGPALPALEARGPVVFQVAGDGPNGTFVEVKNDTALGASKVVKVVMTTSGQVVWDVLLSTPATAVTGNAHLVAVACADSTVHVFNSQGRRLLPAMIVDGPVSVLEVAPHHAMVVTTHGLCYVWNTVEKRAMVNGVSVLPLMSYLPDTPQGAHPITAFSITSAGAPCLTLATNKAVMYDATLGTWIVVADGEDTIQRVSTVQRIGYNLGGGNGTQGDFMSLGRLQEVVRRKASMHPGQAAMRLGALPVSAQLAATRAHLEAQLAVAERMGSPIEVSTVAQSYVRLLADSGDEPRLRDYLNALITNRNDGSGSTDERAAVRLVDEELLAIIAASRDQAMQRLVSEMREMVEDRKRNI